MKILKVDQKNLEKTIKIAAKAIQQGKVLICPTDTVYGILADAGNKKAVEKVFEIKKRPKEKSLPIFVKDLKMAKKLAKISTRQEKILKEIWFTPKPNNDFLLWCGGTGKYTFVLKFQNPNTKFQINSKSQILKKLSKLVVGNENTIGIRIPRYKFLNDLLKKVNKPLAQTSANISGKPISNKIKEIISEFENQKYRPDLVLDAGNLPKSKPSKVIDLTGKTPKFLRY